QIGQNRHVLRDFVRFWRIRPPQKCKKTVMEDALPEIAGCVNYSG
ncbi:MAG: hypothetical protein ACI8W8_001294, partial [Rhodothermales bacterium]